MVIYRTHQRADCVFGACSHAPATHTLVHEFANYPRKYLCADHAQRVMKYFKLSEWRG